MSCTAAAQTPKINVSHRAPPPAPASPALRAAHATVVPCPVEPAQTKAPAAIANAGPQLPAKTNIGANSRGGPAPATDSTKETGGVNWTRCSIFGSAAVTGALIGALVCSAPGGVSVVAGAAIGALIGIAGVFVVGFLLALFIYLLIANSDGKLFPI